MNPTVTQSSPAFFPPLLTRLVDNLYHARGLGLVAPIFRLTLLMSAPALLFGWAMTLTRSETGVPANFNSPHLAIPALLVVAPALETVMMRVMFSLVGRVVSDSLPLNLICALLWGLMHQDSPGGGLHALWGYYVMGAAFLRLQSHSLNRAYAVVILLHALFNTLAYGVYLLR